MRRAAANWAAAHDEVAFRQRGSSPCLVLWPQHRGDSGGAHACRCTAAHPEYSPRLPALQPCTALRLRTCGLGPLKLRNYLPALAAQVNYTNGRSCVHHAWSVALVFIMHGRLLLCS